jgi:hypothetical protein
MVLIMAFALSWAALTSSSPALNVVCISCWPALSALVSSWPALIAALISS